jgi:DNA invertase Pin-like site-specific DNA recombinase
VSGQKGQIVGYVRVSAADQNEARQVEVLSDVGRVFSEKVSGKNVDDRAQLKELLAYVRDGDKVRVKSPDRLARSTRDLLDLIEQFQAKGVAVEFVDNPALNTDTPQGEFMLTILAAVAQLERATIRERQAEGIAIAKRNGVYERALKLTPEQIAHARERIEADVPKAKIARDLGVSRQTLYAALSGTGKYAEVKA